MRDEFPEKVRTILALRANYKCSFTNCGIPTSGPNDASTDSVTRIGVAAHIHAASPGGPRYLESMSSVDRASASNGIWMCGTHSTLIDRDTTAYTPEILRNMKATHESKIKAEMHGTREPESCLIAIGKDLVFSGELIGFKANEWQLRIDHFVIGNISSLITLCERFEQIDPYERYVLVNSIGDGRQLTAAPEYVKTDSRDVVTCKIRNSVPRVNAHNLPRDFALNDDNDMFATNERFAVVSGLDALPQRIKSSLSLQRGESPFHQNVGAIFSEYFDLFQDTPWLIQLIKLEVIRHACVPYMDRIFAKEYTLLQSINSVIKVEMINAETKPNWVLFRFDLLVEGVGAWQKDIPIFIPKSKK